MSDPPAWRIWREAIDPELALGPMPIEIGTFCGWPWRVQRTANEPIESVGVAESPMYGPRLMLVLEATQVVPGTFCASTIAGKAAATRAARLRDIAGHDLRNAHERLVGMGNAKGERTRAAG